MINIYKTTDPHSLCQTSIHEYFWNKNTWQKFAYNISCEQCTLNDCKNTVYGDVVYSRNTFICCGAVHSGKIVSVVFCNLQLIDNDPISFSIIKHVLSRFQTLHTKWS